MAIPQGSIRAPRGLAAAGPPHPDYTARSSVKPRLPPRVRSVLRRAAVLACVVPTVQCLVLRYVDPPITLTMIERALEHRAETGKLRLPDHESVDLTRVPRHVPLAAVTAEDARFFRHAGFDLAEIRNAIDERKDGGGRGASTISMQVARNVFLWQGRSWARKGLEAWYTVFLELLVPKARILEVYLGVAETGPMTFGFERGAHLWFRKEAARLTPEEAGRLVAILPAPRTWSPHGPYARERGHRIATTLVVWED